MAAITAEDGAGIDKQGGACSRDRHEQRLIDGGNTSALAVRQQGRRAGSNSIS
jgi:hypothetical protein